VKKEIVAFTPCPTAAANVGGFPALSPMIQKKSTKTKIVPRVLTALLIEPSHLSHSFPDVAAVRPVVLGNLARPHHGSLRAAITDAGRVRSTGAAART
jgi:hypothetical protein